MGDSERYIHEARWNITAVDPGKKSTPVDAEKAEKKILETPKIATVGFLILIYLFYL